MMMQRSQRWYGWTSQRDAVIVVVSVHPILQVHKPDEIPHKLLWDFPSYTSSFYKIFNCTDNEAVVRPILSQFPIQNCCQTRKSDSQQINNKWGNNAHIFHWCNSFGPYCWDNDRYGCQDVIGRMFSFVKLTWDADPGQWGGTTMKSADFHSARNLLYTPVVSSLPVLKSLLVWPAQHLSHAC